MNRHSIFKIIVRNAIPVVIVLLAMIICCMTVLNHQYKKNVFRNLNSIATILKDDLKQINTISPDPSKVIDLEKYRVGSFRISIIDHHGGVVADTHPEENDLSYLYKRPEIVKGLHGEPDVRVRVNSGKRVFYYVSPLSFEDTNMDKLKTVLYLRFTDLEPSFTRYLPVLLGIALLLLLMTFFFQYHITHREYALYDLIVSKIQSVLKGKDFPGNIPHNMGHYQSLMDEVNELSRRYTQDSTEFTQLKRIQDTFFNSIDANICIVESSGNILFKSASFNQMFSSVDISGKKLQEIARSDELAEILDTVFSTRKNLKREIIWNREFYNVSASYISEENYVALFLYNITDIKQTEIMQREFIQNVSHELKTPLTSIKGFLETLQEDIKDEESLQYLSIIDRNTNRLIRIIQDLFILTRNENGHDKRFEPINISKMIRQLGANLNGEIAEKGLELLLDIDEENLTVVGDHFKLEQVFINLIRNAMQHTEQGMIHLSCFLEKDMVQIIVQDTGIGIPQKHIPFLFDRFYVVDKSRSKKYGGTGLGLSIAKQIVSQHEGTIQIESTVGKGTRVAVEIPTANSSNK